MLRWDSQSPGPFNQLARRRPERSRTDVIRDIRKRREDERLAAEARVRRARLDAIIRRGDGIWREIETEIERRNAPGYDRAASLLADLKTIAAENGSPADFTRQLHSILERHARKARFIAWLNALD